MVILKIFIKLKLSSVFQLTQKEEQERPNKQKGEKQQIKTTGSAKRTLLKTN